MPSPPLDARRRFDPAVQGRREDGVNLAVCRSSPDSENEKQELSLGKSGTLTSARCRNVGLIQPFKEREKPLLTAGFCLLSEAVD